MKFNLSYCGGALMLSAMYITPAAAAITLTTGSGSAVSSVQGSADFVAVTSLNDNPYIEGGMSFSRTNLSFDNNGCGYAGCLANPGFAGFTGNYMYGVGTNGYFDIKSLGATTFVGLEFVIGTGFGLISPQDVTWQAFLNNVLVGSGSTKLPAGSVVGFSGAGGFDTLRYTNAFLSGSENKAPAFDSVRAQFEIANAVPEPETWLMMILGFALIGASMRRRKPQAKVTYKLV